MFILFPLGIIFVFISVAIFISSYLAITAVRKEKAKYRPRSNDDPVFAMRSLRIKREKALKKRTMGFYLLVIGSGLIGLAKYFG